MNKRELKRLICALTAAVMVYLSACGQENNKKVDTNGTPVPSAEATQQIDAPESDSFETSGKIVEQFSQQYDKFVLTFNSDQTIAYFENKEINPLDYEYIFHASEESEFTSYHLKTNPSDVLDKQLYEEFYYIDGKFEIEKLKYFAQRISMNVDIKIIYIENLEPTLVKKQG